MILSEYDEQKHIENEKRWSYEEGIEEGEVRVNRLYELLFQDKRLKELKECLNNKELRLKLMQEYDLIK